MDIVSKPLRIAGIVALVLMLLGAIWIVTARGAEPESPERDAAAAAREAGFDDKERAAIEALVRNYILEHPEVLPEAIDRLRQKQAVAAVDSIREELFTPYPGAVLGNPRGETVLVEFSDYACGFCRQSVEAVEALIAENRDLKVVVRELPILSQDSVEAAKMALAAANQGKYEAFHKAMYEIGKPTPANVEKAAKAAGLDLAKAREAASGPTIMAEIQANHAYANQLQFSGTPAWVTAGQTLQGAVGKDVLSEAIAAKGG